MLVAEDLLLLLTDDDSGRLATPASHVDVGLAGANLLELAMMDRVDLTREGDEGRPGRLVVRDPSATGDDVLDAAVRIVASHQGRKPATAMKPLSKDLRRTLYERLAATGVVRAERGRILGVFPTHTWPAQESGHEADVRDTLTQILVRRTAPDARSAALIALLHALKCEHKIIDYRAHGLAKRELRARADEIAKGDWASEAVGRAIDDMVAAVVAATTAAVVAAGSSNSA